MAEQKISGNGPEEVGEVSYVVQVHFLGKWDDEMPYNADGLDKANEYMMQQVANNHRPYRIIKRIETSVVG